MLVGPLDTPGNDTAVRSLLVHVWHLLTQTIGGLELAFVKSRTVANHDLRRVLVGHNDSRLGELRADSVWIVWHQRLLCHTYVMI